MEPVQEELIGSNSSVTNNDDTEKGALHLFTPPSSELLSQPEEEDSDGLLSHAEEEDMDSLGDGIGYGPGQPKQHQEQPDIFQLLFGKPRKPNPQEGGPVLIPPIPLTLVNDGYPLIKGALLDLTNDINGLIKHTEDRGQGLFTAEAGIIMHLQQAGESIQFLTRVLAHAK